MARSKPRRPTDPAPDPVPHPYSGHLGSHAAVPYGGSGSWGANPNLASAVLGPYGGASAAGYPGSWPAGAGQAAPAEPLRVVHVGPCIGPGGSDIWLLGLIRFFDPKRVRVVRCVVTHPELVNADFARAMPVPVEVGQAEAVRRAARDCDVLLFWAHDDDLGQWLDGCRPPLCVFIAHGEGEWTRLTLRANADWVDHTVAVSRRVRERVCDGFPATTILNGVDSARLGQSRSREEVRASLGFGAEDFVVGYLGRLSPEKRPEALIEAVALLPPRFKALLVGYGARRPSLLELANGRIPGRYAFAQATDYLGEYYRAMDAFCLPSAEEGFGLVLLEAMMCGLPVIASPVGCVPEVIEDRVNGLVVDGSPAAIAAAATLLQRHPEWARGLAAEGRAFADRHGHARRMARQYEDLLERLWAEKHGAGR
jgi:glycosyltransferase involved in cell wall biosynthesis